ncbi:MAG: hypothetical protein IJS37_00100 [Bacilli bacterium]|nr:hypothetical protein [Bacilli bacterium]
MVYNYAKSLKYERSVGRIGSLEVDFILRDPSGEYPYLQVARTIYGEEDENGVDRT